MRISASRLSLASHCLYWARPGAEWDDKPGPAALLGIAVDNHLSAYIAGKEPKKHPRSNKRREQLIAAGISLMKDREISEWRPQVTFAYDWQTGEARELGRDLGRDYSGKRKTEIAGTADVFAVYRNHVYIMDWKTGRQASLEKVGENNQLGFLAMCAAKVYAKDVAIVELCHLQEDGCRHSNAELNGKKMLDIERGIAMLSVEHDNGGFEAITGEHCYTKWCPHRTFCAAYKERYT